MRCGPTGGTALQLIKDDEADPAAATFLISMSKALAPGCTYVNGPMENGSDCACQGKAYPQGSCLRMEGYRNPAMVHRVPEGHWVRRRKREMQIVHRNSQRIIARHCIALGSDPIPGLGSGWVTYASWDNPTADTIS